MNALESAEERLRSGDPEGALAALQEEVRAAPGDARLRIFLFQLLCVLGQWQRAAAQLDVARTLDAKTDLMAQTYRAALECEVVRAEVFAGRKVPLIFGTPEPWLAILLESLLRAGRGELADAAALRDSAFSEAPATAGTIDGVPFTWIADAEARLGPVLEAIVNGRYYWIPFMRLEAVRIEPPADLRDTVWLPAELQFSNGGEVVALLPTRYAGSEKRSDGALLLARKTVWDEPEPGHFLGVGQRLLTTDAGDYPIMDVRAIVLEPAPVSEESVGSLSALSPGSVS